MKAFQMTTKYYTVTTFSQAYGEGTYSQCNYNDSQTCTSASGGSTGGDTGSGSTGTGGGTLTNTGFMVAGIVTLAALIMLVALVVRIARRKTAQTQLAPEPEATDTADTQQR